jgi:flagellar motor switch protein FliN
MVFQDHVGVNGGAPVNGVAAPAALSARLIETVDVRVEAYLGGASASLATLTALKPGSVIELDESLAQPVELRVNGRTIARGELVSIGDRLGVRITEISK